MNTWESVGIYVPTSASGPEVYTTCPKCSPTRKKTNAKCLSANIEKNVWNCAHCGWSGSLAKGEDKRSSPNWWREKEYRKPAFQYQTPADKIQSWFNKRGISLSTLVRNKVSYGKTWMPQVEDFVWCIQFPFMRGEEIVNIKHRDNEKNFRQEKDCERIFFGLNDLAEETVIVEGEIDKLSIEEAGITACVSVPDGAPAADAKNYTSKFEFLENCEKDVEKVKSWVIAVDNDEPGRALQRELVRRLRPERCKLVEWPEGCKDANDVLVNQGPEALAKCIKEAQQCPVAGVYEITQIQTQIANLYRDGSDKGVSTGWGNVDALYRVRPGEWTVVTGIPGSGKSEWLDAVFLNLAREQGWSFGIFSPENQPIEQHVKKLAEKYIDKPFGRGPTERMTPDQLIKACEFLHRHFSFILPDDDDSWGLDNILKLASSLVTRKGIKGLIIDPWNEIEHCRQGALSEPEYISQSLTKVRRWARSHGVHVWIVAHPTKLKKGDDGTYPCPTPYDISGAAHWRNKADYAIAVHRPNMQADISEVHVQKVRFKEMGVPGMAKFTWNRITGNYTEEGYADIKEPVAKRERGKTSRVSAATRFGPRFDEGGDNP